MESIAEAGTYRIDGIVPGGRGGLRGRAPLVKVGAMLRFRLGDIPITVRFSHLAVCALLGTLMVRDLPALEPGAWPAPQLDAGSGPAYARTALFVSLAFVLLLSVTVFAHEVGHAVMLRVLGYRPSIELFWLGGLTRPDGPAALPWHHQAMMSAGGPLAGLILGLGALALRHAEVLVQAERARFVLGWMAVINLLWTLFNLLPVPNLDGGTLVSTLATRLFGRTGFLGAQALALVLCVALVAFGLRYAPLASVLFGMYGVQALRRLVEGEHAPLPAGLAGEDSPLERALREAREALGAGRLEEAHARASAVLEDEACDLVQGSRAHHLLGWVALKQGQGRAALDHFSQVQRQTVEPHAVAAAFSLVGDEPRALALWSRAWEETRDPTILHEYAGSLIRAEQAHHALRLPGVEPEAAFLCAGRPLFLRGAYSEAATLAEAGLVHAPGARLAYDAACAHARAHHVADAVRMLRRAAELGFQDAHYASSDEDLAALHGHPDFERWLTELPKSLLA